MRKELEFKVTTSDGKTDTIKESKISELTRTEDNCYFVTTITGKHYSISKEDGERIFERMVITQ